ncbi:MAG: D-aminoacylase [Desulfobacterota bacterium]|nr:D-aminoacylase [Thermodesulfobacteriota bacterium]
MDKRFDVVIEDGQVIDGTGRPAFAADVGIRHGKIDLIASRIDEAAARKVIHAHGLVVCPGFIDTHSHDDFYLLVHPKAPAKVRQGVTTTSIGHCGFSAAPWTQERLPLLQDALRFMGAAQLPSGQWGDGSFSGFLAHLNALEPGINVVPLVGHNTLRMAAMGMAQRDPLPDELSVMKRLLAGALQEGAFGLSSGLVYPPGSCAKTAELIALGQTAAAYGGIYLTHMRNESGRVMEALAEAIEIGREGRLPVVLSHHKTAGRSNWGRSVETLARIQKARAAGQTVALDVYPYTASSTYLAVIVPPDMTPLDHAHFKTLVGDPEFRDRLKRRIAAGGNGEDVLSEVGFEGILVSASQRHPEFAGRSAAQLGEALGRDPLDILLDLLAEEGRAVQATFFWMAEEDVARILADPHSMVGSDGLPAFGPSHVHPRFFGTFPRVLSKYVRQDGVLTLEEAVRKMTSLPASIYGLQAKGRLKIGLDADLVLFDPETIRDTATFIEPDQAPEGIPYVLVGGRLAVEEGRVTGTARGSVLRHPPAGRSNG